MALIEFPIDAELSSTLADAVQHLLDADRAARWRDLLVDRKKAAKLDPFEFLSAERRGAGVQFVAFKNALEFKKVIDRFADVEVVGLWWKPRAEIVGLRGTPLALYEAALTRRADRWLVSLKERASFLTTHEGDMSFMSWTR